MKNSYIIGIVWNGIIVCLISFGATVFFLNDTEKSESNNVLSLQQNDKETQVSYITNESSIRTNNVTSLDNKNTFLQQSLKVNDVSQNSSDAEKLNSNRQIIEDELEEIVEITIENKQAENNNEEIDSIETANSNVKSFIRPVKGDVTRPMSLNELIFSKTLNEWNIHKGTDYDAKLGDEVYAIRDGRIKRIDFDYIYGNYIAIEHDEGYESLCSNITVLDALHVGDTVKQGDVIGYVAESFGFEAAEATHLHFELKKNGNYISINN